MKATAKKSETEEARLTAPRTSLYWICFFSFSEALIFKMDGLQIRLEHSRDVGDVGTQVLIFRRMVFIDIFLGGDDGAGGNVRPGGNLDVVPDLDPEADVGVPASFAAGAEDAAVIDGAPRADA